MEKGQRVVKGLFLMLMLLVALPLLFMGDSEVKTAEAKPDKVNPDAISRSSGSINRNIYTVDFLKPADFAGNPYSNKWIREGELDGGYTCWANGSSGYDFYTATTDRHPFGGTIGKGNEAYGETRHLQQCENDKKLIEYEIHASNNLTIASMNPQVANNTVSGKKANYLTFTGWATLGGFTHHSGWNQSTYVAAVEQVNGKNTTSASGVKITKAIGSDVSMTNYLSYGDVPMCNGNSATGTYSYEKGSEYNRYRGIQWFTALNSTYVKNNASSVLSYRWYANDVHQTTGTLYRHALTQQRWFKQYYNPYSGANYNYGVHGLGCNFQYPQAGFRAYVNLDDILGDGKEDKEFKIYLIKRVEDMIVATEMQMPKYTENKSIKYGDVSFKGYNDSTTVSPNRTGLPAFTGFNKTTHFLTGQDWNYDGHGSTHYLSRDRNFRLDKVHVSDSGLPSVYQVYDTTAKKTYYHFAHYFDHNRVDKGVTLSYKVKPKTAQVRHYSFFTCPTAIQNNITANLYKDLTSSGCLFLKEKSGGAWAYKGSKTYTKNFYTQWFYAYDGSELYRSSTSENYTTMTASRTVELNGNGVAHINFFYYNNADAGSLTVKYINNMTGGRLQPDHKVDLVQKGTTITFPMPGSIADGRTFYLMDSPSNSIKITGNNTVTLRYNANPNITFEYIDRTTGKKLGEDTYHHQRFTNFSKTPPSTVDNGGKTYYRESSGAVSYTNVYKDTTLKIYYTNQKEVVARHYDYYSCPENVRGQRAGNIHGTSCIQLKEKSNGKLADRGSGTYETNMEHSFFPYSNASNSLYKTSTTLDKYNSLYPSSYKTMLSGTATTYINQFYINDRDIGNLRVKYVDRQSGTSIRSDYVKTKIEKGTVETYSSPNSIAFEGRTYYKEDSDIGRTTITGDNNNITIEYNYNPNITVRMVDRDTGKLLNEDVRLVQRGETHKITPDAKFVSGGSTFYRENSGVLTFNTLWKDTTVTEYYSKYKDVTVRHYSYYSCDLSEATHMLGALPTEEGCLLLREKDTGEWAAHGTGRYETEMEHRFYKYANSSDNLYRANRTTDNYYAENASSQVVHLKGKDRTIINFFYKNRSDETKLTVHYKDRQSGKTLRTSYVQDKIYKGTTVEYPMPDAISDGTRPYYRYGNQTGRVVMTGDREITVQYNYNPDITIKMVDRDTGKLLGEDTKRVSAGGTYNITPTAKVTDSGSNFYRENSGALTFSEIWKDTTVTEYYSKYKDVTVRHYAFYSCDLSEATHMLGDLNPLGAGCLLLKEKDTGNSALYGSGRYETDKTHKFWKYANSADNLFRANKTTDSYYAENGSAQDVKLEGKEKTYINFFYKNRAEEVALTVKYVDRQSGKSLRDNYNLKNIHKGTTVDYPMPDSISDGVRPFYRYGNQTGRVVMTDNRVITVQYNYNPDVIVRKVDRETGKLLGTYEKRITGGTNLSYTPETKITTGGSTYYREKSGALSWTALWVDTTVTEYYSKYKDVVVRHYDYHRCDLSEATHMLGDIHDKGCNQLREKSTGQLADRGSGRYETDMTHKFYKYGNLQNSLYRTDKVNDEFYAENASSQDVALKGKETTYINFFYRNKRDEAELTVKYIDRQTRKELREPHVVSQVFKGSTVSYPIPGILVDENNRSHYIYSNLTGRHVLTEDTEIRVLYNYNPKITYEKYDRETGKLIEREVRDLVRGGTAVLGTGLPISTTDLGKTKFRLDNSHKITAGGRGLEIDSTRVIPDVWEDTTIRANYSNKRDVVVNAFDRRAFVLENGKQEVLREIATGNIARKGSGMYEGGMVHNFDAYGSYLLYNRDINTDRFFIDTQHESTKQNISVLASHATINSNAKINVNFYYTNKLDVRHMRFTYYNPQDRVYIADEDLFRDRFHDTYINSSELSQTNIIKYNGRTYDYVDGNLPTRFIVNSNNITTLTTMLNYNKRPQITYELIDRDTGKVLETKTTEIKYNANHTYINPEFINVGGKQYTSYAKPSELTLRGVKDDTKLVYEYTSKVLKEKPEKNVKQLGTTEGLADINKLNWKMYEEDIGTESGVEVGGTHAYVFSAKGREFYGKDVERYEDARNEYLNGKVRSYKSEQNFSAIDYRLGYENSEDLTKAKGSFTNAGNNGNYVVEYQYEYTNYLKVNFKCDYGTSDRCFEWVETTTLPYTEDEDIVVTNPDGTTETVPARDTFELRVELENDVEVGKEEEVSISATGVKPNGRLVVPFDETYKIGEEFVGTDEIEGQTKVKSGTYTNTDGVILSKKERIRIDPLVQEGTASQGSLGFDEEVIYDNNFGLELEETDVYGTYKMELDKNLKESLTSEGDKSEVGLRLDETTGEFNFDKVFGVSKKYGIQVAVDYEDYIEDNDSLRIELESELLRLGLGTDELVELDDQTKSRYFLPIDDEELLVGDTLEDEFSFEGLGVNDITVKFEKDVKFDRYLYGNIFDNPIYVSQNDIPKKIDVYKNSEQFTTDSMKDASRDNRELERKETINLYRSSNDDGVKAIIEEHMPSDFRDRDVD